MRTGSRLAARLQARDDANLMVVVIDAEDSLDLHLFRPSEVAAAAEAYLDAAAEAGLREVRLIHGRGVGVQRDAVRKVCSRHPRVDPDARILKTMSDFQV